MKQPQPSSSGLYRFCCGIVSFILFLIGVPTFVEACDRSNHDEPSAWLLFIAAITAFILAYRVYRPVRAEARRRKEAEEAALYRMESQYPDFAAQRAREREMTALAKAIAEEMKKS